MAWSSVTWAMLFLITGCAGIDSEGTCSNSGDGASCRDPLEGAEDQVPEKLHLLQTNLAVQAAKYETDEGKPSAQVEDSGARITTGGKGEGSDNDIAGLLSAAITVTGLTKNLGPVQTFMDELPFVSVGPATTAVYDVSAYSEFKTAGTAGNVVSQCGVASAAPATLFNEMGAIACVDFAVGVGMSNSCGLCFGGVYATMDSTGLNTVLKRFIGVSPIESFALFSNVQASIVLSSEEIGGGGLQPLPYPLNEELVPGINIFGVISKPTSCTTFGVTDIMCELINPMWSKLPDGIILYSTIAVTTEAPYTVSSMTIGIKVTGIPVKGSTVFNEIDLAYSLVLPEPGSPDPPSTAVAGGIEIGTTVDSQPLTFRGGVEIGLEATKTTFLASASMQGMVALPTRIAGLFKMSIYDLQAKVGLAITAAGGLPTVEEFLIGGGLCLGADSDCDANYNQVGDLDTVVMGAMYFGMKVEEEEGKAQFGLSLKASPLSLKKLLNVLNIQGLGDAIPDLILNAELTGYKDCTDSSDMMCWVVIQANAGTDPLEFDFADEGGPDLTIDPGVVISSGIKFGGAHGGVYVEGDGDFLKMRMAMTPLSLFGGSLNLTRSAFSTDAVPGADPSSSGPVMKLDANYASMPPSIKFQFSARMQLWDMLDAQAYIRMDLLATHFLATGFPLYYGALTADAFLVQDLKKGLLKLGILIHTDPIVKALSKPISDLKKSLNGVKSSGNAIKKKANDVRALLSKRLDNANDDLNKDKKKLDNAKKKLDDANKKLSSAQKKFKSMGCFFQLASLTRQKGNVADSGKGEISDAGVHEEESLDSDEKEDAQEDKESVEGQEASSDPDKNETAQEGTDSKRALLTQREEGRRRKNNWDSRRRRRINICGSAVKAAFKAAKATVNAAKGPVSAAQATVNTYQTFVNQLKKYSDQAGSVTNALGKIADKIVNAVKVAIDVLDKNKLLGIGFKAQFQVGATLGASVSATMFSSNNGKTDEADQIGAQFYPNSFVVPDEAQEDYHWTVVGNMAGNGKITPECHKKSNEKSEGIQDDDGPLAVTCCDSSGKGSRPGCKKSRTWDGAKEICEGKGLSLCTKAQIEGGAGKSTGCGFDNYLNWVSDTCQAEAKDSKNLEKKTVSVNLKADAEALAKSAFSVLFSAATAGLEEVEDFFKPMAKKFENLENIKKEFNKVKLR